MAETMASLRNVVVAVGNAFGQIVLDALDRLHRALEDNA
jgi:hypothetical protein